MPSFYNAGQLFTIISSLCQNEMQDLGTDSDPTTGQSQSQKDAVYRLMNVCLWDMPRVVYWSQYSDQLNLSADGYFTFQYKSTDISDMFEPQMVLQPNGQPLQKRTSDDAPIGWWRESQNLQIHIRGFTSYDPLIVGNYQLKYLKYPKQITIDADEVQIAPSGYNQLIFNVCRMIKLSRNSYQGADFMGNQADKALSQALQGAISARGTGSTGQPPSDADVQNVRS
jgi:hypothetical protein